MSLSVTCTNLLKYLPVWELHYFPGQDIPVRDHPLCEEILPNVQTKLPLVLLEIVSLYPIASHLRKETKTLLTEISCPFVSSMLADEWDSLHTVNI